MSQVPFNGNKVVYILLAAKGIGLARLAGTCGTTNAVDIVLGLVGKVVVYYHGKVVHIDSTSRYISGHQAFERTSFKGIKDLQPLGLGQVSNNKLAFYSIVLQSLGNHFTATLGVAEYD